MKKEKNAAALIFLFAGIIGIIILMLLKAGKDSSETEEFFMPSNSYRVGFLNANGIIVKPDPKTQDIVIPEEFGNIYAAYSELQKSQGFDLEKYKGRSAVMYSYDVLNCPDHIENVSANLIICDGRLIACDITLNEENGFTKAIIGNTE